MPNAVRALIVALVLLSCAGARAQTTDGKAALCSGCHGSSGVPADPSIPVIWGQNEGYIYFQLRDFKAGARKSAIMGPMTATLDKQAMLDLAAYFAAKPWPNLAIPAAPGDVARQAERINESAGCKGCHGGEWRGDGTTPRVSGQNLAYLRQSMILFRTGERANNPWMTALLKTYPDTDIETMARYIAGY